MTDEIVVDDEPQDTPEAPIKEEPAAPAKDVAPADDPKAEPADKDTPEEPKKEPEVDAEEAPEESTDEFDYSEYTNPALKQAVVLLREANVPVEVSNAAFAGAIETGDISKVDRVALVDALGEEKADLVLVLAESYMNTQSAGMKAILEEAHAITGGEENYKAMQEWVTEKSGTDPEFAKDLVEFRAMLDSEQPRTIKAALTELFTLYKNDPDTTIAADLQVGDKTGGDDVTALSRAEYTAEVDKARKNRTYDKVRASLWQRRQAGMKKNL